MTGKLIDDAAKRLSDAVNLHVQVLPRDQIIRGAWIGARLADGRHNGTVYDTRREAIAYHEKEMMPYAYVRLRPLGMTYAEAEAFMRFARFCHDNGIPLADPEANPATHPALRRFT